jgi:hypothetical protein
VEDDKGNVVVSVDELRLMVETLFRHLEETVGPSVTIRDDLFWAVPPDKLFDVYSQVVELTIGSLVSNIDELRSIQANPERALNHALTWMADVLRAVGAKNDL